MQTPPPERIPSQSELLAAARELGLVGEDSTRVPPRHYKKLVDVVRESWREITAEQDAAAAMDRAAADAAAFSVPISEHMAALQRHGITEPSAARIVAAIAPQIWRDLNNKGAAHS